MKKITSVFRSSFKLRERKIKNLFCFLLIMLCFQAFSQDFYRFGGLGTNDSGGVGFKLISTTSILAASNQITNVTGGIVGAELFSTNTTPGATAVFTIKADGINAISFDVDDLTIFNYLSPINGPSTYTTSTQIVFKNALGNTIRTMTLNANKSLSENNSGVSIGTFFDNNNALPVTGVSEIEFTINPLTDQPDALTLKGITISNVTEGTVPTGAATIDFNNTGITNDRKLGKTVSLGSLSFSINSLASNDFISFKETSGSGGTGALYDDNADIGGVTKWTIKRHGGAEFAVSSIYIQDSGVGASTSGTLKAYKDGSQVGSTVNINFDGNQVLSGNTDFQDIDELWIEAVDLNVFIDNVVYSIPSSLSVPTVTTSASTSVLSNGATLNGDVTSDGGATITERGFVYALTSDDATPTVAESGGANVIKVIVSGTIGSFNQAISSLLASSNYSFSAYAINSEGTTEGTIQTFTTHVDLPHILNFETTDNTNLGSIAIDGEGGSSDINGIQFDFEILDAAGTPTNGDVIYNEFGGEYEGLHAAPSGSFWRGMSIKTSGGSEFDFNGFSVSENNGTVIVFTVEGFRDGSSTGSTTVNHPGFTPTTYTTSDFANGTFGNVDEIRIIANLNFSGNFDNFALGLSVTPPTITTTAAISVDAISATLGGDVTSDGGATIIERGFVYALTSDDASPTVAEAGGANVTKVIVSGTTGSYNQAISSLIASSNYSFSAYAINSQGTAEGTVETFTTSNPTVAFTSTSSSGAENVSSTDLEVSLSAVSGSNVSVDYVVTGTATGSGTDYTLVDGSLTITAGDSNNDITIGSIVSDAILEANETVIVTISNPSNATLGTNLIHTYTINNDDSASVTIADVSGNEDDGSITVTATLDNAVQGGFTVDVSTSDGTATTADSDYTALTSQTLTFTGTASEMQTFTVTPTSDNKLESNETLTISQSNVASTSLSVNITDGATVTITNDDSASVTIADVSGNENDGSITVTATLDNAVQGGFTVDVSTADGTATTGDSDYSAITSQSLSFTGNASETQTFTVTPTGDTKLEANETLTISQSNVASTSLSVNITDGATVTITNDDSASVTIADVSGNENDGSITVTATLDNAVQGGFTVDVSTTDGTATTSDNDYSAVTGQTLSFTGNASETQTFTVTPTGDTKLEANETITISQSNLAATVLSVAITDGATVTINNDDSATVTIADVSGNEDDGSITVTATLDNAVQGGFTVDVSTSGGTATTADSDYTSLTGQTLTFTGTASEMQTFTVTPTSDNKLESNETLTISQSNVASTSLSVNITDGATVTITNDDSASVTIADVSGNENDGSITVTATLDNAVQGGFTVDVSTADGTATTGDSDYSAITSQSLSFTGNASETQTFTLTPTGDTKLEANETITISQSNLAATALSVTITDGATVTILNDDFQATITTSDANSITSNMVDLGGEVTAEGSSSVIARGIVYAITSENANPQIGGANVITDDNGVGLGVFNETISGLVANTQYSYVAYATNTQGTSYGSVKTFSTTTLGIEEESLNVSINVYPNPVNKILHIKANNIKLEEATLYNILGKVIKNIEIENKTIDFSSMANGIYLLKIVTSEGILIRRVVKK